MDTYFLRKYSGWEGSDDVKLPGNYTVTNPLTNETIVIPDVTKCEIAITSYTSPPISDSFKSVKNLAPGFYSAVLNRVLIKNVPVVKGKVTRLKAGFLLISLNDVGNPYCHLYRYNEYDNMITVFEYQFHGGKYALPPGKYFLSIHNNPDQDRYKITIKDGETVINGVKQN